MARQSIPDDEQLAGNVAEQVRQELDDLGAADCARKQPKVKVPPRHPRHRRQHLPVEVILQHWGLSPWRPGAAAVRALTQSAFVDEDDGAAFVVGFFLISGQRCCFHRRILSSSRSCARPTGRWQLHPNCRRIRQACEGWYFTSHSCSIKWATRHEFTSWFRIPAPQARASARARCAVNLRAVSGPCAQRGWPSSALVSRPASVAPPSG